MPKAAWAQFPKKGEVVGVDAVGAVDVAIVDSVGLDTSSLRWCCSLNFVIVAFADSSAELGLIGSTLMGAPGVD